MSTNISWTDVTWNPVTGCSKVSAGCVNCYAARQAPRLAAMGQKGYTALPWTAKNASENVMTHEDRLEKPMRWKKPRRVFVNSMSDLFHEQVPDAFIDKVFAVMALAPQHTFQILTKRPERMAEYLTTPVSGSWAGRMFRVQADGRTVDATDAWRRVYDAMTDTFKIVPAAQLNLAAEMQEHHGEGFMPRWPLPNVWLGTSVEDQRAADERIPHLLRTPATVRFLSCEPLIGPVDLTTIRHGSDPHLSMFEFGAIHWVIAGGESGPGHRPMDPDWPRLLRDQCCAEGVPFFFKQWGGARSEGEALLDGREWRQFPVQEVKHG